MIIWLIDKVFHRFSLSKNSDLSEFNWKGLEFKGGNKRPCKDLKFCEAVKGEHQRSMFLQLGWIKLHSSELN